FMNLESCLLFIREWLDDFKLSSGQIMFFRATFWIVAIYLLSLITNFITKKIIKKIVKKIVLRSSNDFDDILYEKGVFNRLSHIIPALIIYFSAPTVLSDYTFLIKYVISLNYIYLIIVVLLVINAFIDALHEAYLRTEVSKTKSIKSYVQVFKIIFYFVAAMLVLSVLLNKSPFVLLAGLGAIAAVLLLVFKDALLGLTASIHLSANNMVKPGDWIQVQSKNLEGTVAEISLSTVKIINDDKTISYIPTYFLVSENFINWASLRENGVRRINRSFFIDMRSIKPADDLLLNSLSAKFPLLKDYIDNNQKILTDDKNTNIFLFRKYIELYLKNHPKISKELYIIIRYQQMTDKGLPLNILAFVKNPVWAEFEEIQTDIIDHLFSIVSNFQLTIFQSLSEEK
ncbi:MAG: mechanosensitive ion channel, partial [Bacteroidales bacterium]|nr:mechanosensitive ion channel [Bacteroidales bacterium]